MGDFHAASFQRAAKPHICYCCKRVIPKGVAYARIAGVWEGDFWIHKSHEDCHRAYHDFRDACGGDEMSADYVEELQGWGSVEAQQTLDFLRGHFPHVVCRLEFTMRSWLQRDDEDEA